MNCKVLLKLLKSDDLVCRKDCGAKFILLADVTYLSD